MSPGYCSEHLWCAYILLSISRGTFLGLQGELLLTYKDKWLILRWPEKERDFFV